MQYVIGADVGTTGAKAILVDEKGRIVNCAYEGYALLKPGNGHVEQRAEDWWKAFTAVVGKCAGSVRDKKDILAISVSTQGASLVAVDKCGIPLAPAIVWMDQRGGTQREALLKLHDDNFYYSKTGWRLRNGGNLVQIKWLHDNEKDLFDKTFKFLSTQEFINYRLTGRYVIDPTNGGMTQLMDIRTADWDESLMEAAGIPREKLAQIEKSGSGIGNLTSAAAHELGLSTTTRVINGGHDQYCAAMGAGAVHAGDLLLSTGTAWIVLGIFSEPVYDSHTYIAPGRHIAEKFWGALASIPTGGVSMEWFRDSLVHPNEETSQESRKSFADIDRAASAAMESAKDIFFYPYFLGSGFPRWNSRMKACLMGLGLEHSRYDVARAIMEGLAFEAALCIEEYRKKGCRVSLLRMLGGAAKSTLWTEIIAAVMGIPVVRFGHADSACSGAAVLAGCGCGLYAGYEDGARIMMGPEKVTEPEENKKAFYREKFAKYKQGLRYMEGFYEKD